MGRESQARRYDDMARVSRVNGILHQRHTDLVRALTLPGQIRGAYGEYNSPLHDTDSAYARRVRTEAMAAFDDAVPNVPLLKAKLRGQFMLKLIERIPSQQDPFIRGHRLLDRANEVEPQLQEMYDKNIVDTQEFVREDGHILARVAMHDAIEQGVEFRRGVAGISND